MRKAPNLRLGRGRDQGGEPDWEMHYQPVIGGVGAGFENLAGVYNDFVRLPVSANRVDSNFRPNLLERRNSMNGRVVTPASTDGLAPMYTRDYPNTPFWSEGYMEQSWY